MSIYGDFNTPNNDGIDIDDSNNTVITRCNINTGDDAICPKTYDGPLYNLTATDSWIRTKSSGIKLGSASWFEFKGLLFNNITIVDSHRGLGLQIRDGGMNITTPVVNNYFANIKYVCFYLITIFYMIFIYGPFMLQAWGVWMLLNCFIF